jgi:hypothetical protein
MMSLPSFRRGVRCAHEADQRVLCIFCQRLVCPACVHHAHAGHYNYTALGHPEALVNGREYVCRRCLREEYNQKIINSSFYHGVHWNELVQHKQSMLVLVLAQTRRKRLPAELWNMVWYDFILIEHLAP